MFEALELLVYAAVLWPVTLGAVLGIVLSFLISLALPTLPHTLWPALALLGAIAGGVWQVARETATNMQHQKVSAPVAFLGIAFISGIWGALISAIAGPMPAFVCLMGATLLLGKVYYFVANQRLQIRTIWLACFAAVVGFSAPYVFTFIFAP